MSNVDLIDRLAAVGSLSLDEYEALLATYTRADRDHATAWAYRIARERFGESLALWGQVNISNACDRDCYYCALRRTNERRERYRLSTDEVLACCDEGYRAGVRTFLLEAGEDGDFADDVIDDMIWRVRKHFSDASVGLALGEHSRAVYQRFFDAGADRYLLRHETADGGHYASLHPRRMTLSGRIRCLEDLRSIGFSTGTGFMVGTPGQTAHHLAQDLAFLADFQPSTVSIGPFVPSAETPLADQPKGATERTVFLISLARILLPDAAILVDTAIATAHHRGRELAVMAGANVLVTDLTPPAWRPAYAAYDGKITEGVEGVEGLDRLRQRMADIHYTLSGPPREERRGRRGRSSAF